MSSDYSANTEINLLNKLNNIISQNYNQLSTEIIALDNLVNQIYNQLSADVTKVTVTNIPNVQNTAPQNTVLNPVTITLSTTATISIQLNPSSIAVNELIINNNSSTNSIYIGFGATTQNYLISPYGKFIYESDIRQININTIYVKGPSGIDVTYTYWS
jgi:hypothetical protein